MADDFYETDFVSWTESQATLLRQIGKASGLDVDHLAEEIEDLGRSEILRVKSLLRQALSHILKIASKPDAESVHHWRHEVSVFIADAQDQYRPAYQQRIDMDEIWRKAVKIARDDLAGFGGDLIDIPKDCPFDLAYLLEGEDFDLDDACSILKEGPHHSGPPV